MLHHRKFTPPFSGSSSPSPLKKKMEDSRQHHSCYNGDIFLLHTQRNLVLCREYQRSRCGSKSFALRHPASPFHDIPFLAQPPPPVFLLGPSCHLLLSSSPPPPLPPLLPPIPPVARPDQKFQILKKLEKNGCSVLCFVV